MLAVGPGKKNEDGKREAPNVKIGGTVLYSKYSGTEFEVIIFFEFKFNDVIRIGTK